MGWTESVKKFRVFLEMIKFQHSLFVLPFAYMGLWLAEHGWPRLDLFLWVTVAMVSFRTMAMGLNRLIDRRSDRLNPRTENRALPKGQLKPSFVWLIIFAAFAVFEFSAYQLNLICFKLSWIPVLLAWIYPWTKRFTWLSHLVLGIILGIAPYGAWLASRGTFSWIPGLITLGVTAWVAGFDIIYALQDLEFDRHQGLSSFPARFGRKMSLTVTHALHGFALAMWGMAGWRAGLGIIYFFGIAVVAVFLIRENYLARSFGLSKLEEAFFTMNIVVSLSLFAVTLLDFSLRGAFL